MHIYYFCRTNIHFILKKVQIHYAFAFLQEQEGRRLFLWLPICAGAGVCVYFSLLQEPFWPLLLLCFLLPLFLLPFVQNILFIFYPLCGIIAFCFGLLCASSRTWVMASPMLDRPHILRFTGFIEELNPRPEGARLILRIEKMENIPQEATPYRIRVTSKVKITQKAGDVVQGMARLVPPPTEVLPGGYHFRRDAFFLRIGAVGHLLGSLTPAHSLASPPFFAPLDRIRNTLAERIQANLEGPKAAIAIAMVTGKRDFLDETTKDLIKEAGIFHIITISGIQMTLVAGILFKSFRFLLSLNPFIALHYPIKKWAAGLAMGGALVYNFGTGSRLGTQRALFMTLILLGAILVGRRAFSMRNLALSMFLIILLEPESILSSSFQLSFSAVAALISLYERKISERSFPYTPLQEQTFEEIQENQVKAHYAQLAPRIHRFEGVRAWLKAGPIQALRATLWASLATAPFMAYHFHELSPYVLIGNPLTLLLIEFFAIPCALLGSLCAFMGIDGWIWYYLGLGIDIVLWFSDFLAHAPFSTLYLPAFAPYALPCLSLGLLQILLWRTGAFRLFSIPLLTLGLVGTCQGPKMDLLISPEGNVIGLRDTQGFLKVVGRNPSAFMVEQWLRAGGDGRSPKEVILSQEEARCTKGICSMHLPFHKLTLVLEFQGFYKECATADILITPLRAPRFCTPPYLIDKDVLRQTGALGLVVKDRTLLAFRAREEGDERPWNAKGFQ